MDKRNGFALVASLLTVSVLVVIALPYVAGTVTEYNLMSKMLGSSLAVDLAEAGADRAIWEICYNNSAFSGWTSTNLSGNQTWTISNVPFGNTAGNAIGYYDVSVSLPGGTTTQTITSTAYIPTKAAPKVTKKVVVTYAGGQYHFTNAIAAAGSNPSIVIGGSVRVDSYDSSVGPYGSPLQTDTRRGNIAANGPITMGGSAYVYGDARPGPNNPFHSRPRVSGSYATLSAPITVNPIPASTINAARSANNNGNITVTSGTTTTAYTGGTSLYVGGSNVLTIPGGTYYFTSMVITGNARVNVTGPSTIYVDGGAITIAGSGVVNGGVPANLGIYSTGSSIVMAGNSAYIGTIYAPSASVTIGGSENFYGAIVCGSSVDGGNASIHFDLALLNATTAPANYRATSWLEQ
jgi:hypothetical protein